MYTNRKTLYFRGNVLCIVARFDDATWRRSAHRDAPRYDTREQAIESAIVGAYGSCDSAMRAEVSEVCR